MKSFGRLLRRLRGEIPIHTAAQKAHVEPLYWMNVETGKTIPDITTAHTLIEQGFGLPPADSQRLILGVQLYDLGLKDNDLRQLFIDLLVGIAPPGVRDQLRQVYRAYAEE